MSVADWQGALLTLGDGPFFDLMRSYLGDIRTPFNKQRLVEDLEGFLRRKDIQETVAAYLDETDKLMVAAIGSLGEPTADELAGFFEGQFSYAELHAVVLNLEERLILYRFIDGSSRRLALNPVLAPVLDPIAADASPLFPSVAAEEAPPAAAGESSEALDGLLFASVVAYVRRRAEIFRSDGSFRKKILEDVASSFDADRFVRGVDALHALGILDLGEAGVRVDEVRLAGFAALPSGDRAFYAAAGLCGAELAGDNLGGRRGRLSRERLSVWARLFRTFADTLLPDRAYPETTLHRLLDSAERSVSAPRRRRWDSRSADPGAELRGSVDSATFRTVVVRALCYAGILERRSESLFVPSGRSPGGDSAGPVLSADSAFSVIAYPEIPFPDALALTRFLDIREAGRTARFELCRESAVRGFNAGLSPGAMIDTLERLSGRAVPQNVRWSLRDWHDRYLSVAVYRGVVLSVAEDRRFVMEAPAVAALVQRELAPGMYLLAVGSEAEAAAVLEQAGLDIVAVPEPKAPDRTVPEDGRFSPFAPLDRAHSASHPLHRRGMSAESLKGGRPIDGVPSLGGGGGPAAAAARLSVLKQALDGKSLPKDQKDELAARLDRRVVLSESQLVGAAVRYEKLEAKGLDYVGKVRVAEQAISTGSLVELFWRGSKGEPNRALGAPVALEKNGGEVELTLDPAPRGERLRIAVGRISLIRRIKRSIFGE